MRTQSIALAVLLVSAAVDAQCITGVGAIIPVTQDSITGANAIGFAFPFAGTTYTDIHISDHGMCFLSNNNVPPPPSPAAPLVYSPAAASLVLNSPVICPLWSDTIPGAPAAVFHIDAQPTQCTVSWIAVQSFGIPLPKMSLQMKLFPTGEIEFLYDLSVTNNSTFGGVSDNGVVGVSPGTPSVLPAGVNFLTSPNTVDNTIFHQYTLPNTFDMKGATLRLIPTNPGWVTVFTAGGANCAGSQAYGSGCGGLSLSISAPPIVNTSINIVTAGITLTAPFGAVAFGFVRNDPGLVIPGAPVGCRQYNELLVTNLFLPLGAPTVTVPFTVPNFPGVALQVTSVTYDPSAIAGPLSVNTTGGIELRLGN